jgi:NitT/TauT family transport system ATP-binding protein
LSVAAAALPSAPPGALVLIAGVSKEFRQGQNQVRALDDVSLTFGHSELVTIVGASGCGKTTLLSMMAGLVEPTSGTIIKDPRVARRGGVGMVFQSPVLLPWRNVMGNVLAPAEIYGMGKKQANERAQELLTQVDLRGFEKSMPYQLSGGMQQRVAICRALLSDPPLLLMDEPFGALDALTRERMNIELQRIFLLGQKTVVLVTHSIEEAVFLSDRIIAMTPRPGRIAQVIQNELPRPRTVDTYESALFTEYASHVRKLVMGPGAQAIAA